MAGLPSSRIQDARQCLEQARNMLERARVMWFRAHESLEEAQLLRAALQAQIEGLAKRGAFSRQFTTRLLSRILNAVIEGTGADMGNIQLLEPESGRLRIRVQHGFREPFLRFFDSVHRGQGACGTALETRQRVIVPDVADSPIFRSTDCLETMLDAGVRAVQSTLLIGKSKRIWGMLSTHYRSVNQPCKKDLPLIDYFADWAAALLEAEHRSPRGTGKTSSDAGVEASTTAPGVPNQRLLPLGVRTRIGLAPNRQPQH